MKSFINQLITTIDKKDSCSVVGLDPQLEYIPLEIKEASLRKKGDSLNNAARAVLDFNKQIINIIHRHVGIVKLQIAFYEMLGPWGLRAYSDTIKYAKKKT
jgi:orotidine-5'-phosphate decarboxylase